MGKNATPVSFSLFAYFTTVPIPAGATITSAKIRLKASASLSGASCIGKVHFEAADSPTSPTSFSDYYSRSLTTGIDWTIPSTTAESWYDSEDLTTDLQAIVDRAGWSLNNNIGVQIRDNGSSTGAYRQFYGVDSGAANGAILVVEFSS